MIVENNNLDLPDDFTEEFFIKILENGFHVSDIKIFKITITMGSSGGENYCSQIYRVKIEYFHEKSKIDPENVSVIIKYMSDLKTSNLLDQFYKNELNVFRNVLPLLENLFNGNLKFGPKYYYHLKNQIPIIVMEDLASLNFMVADRLIGMNEKQTKIVLKKIANFHAASMVLAEKNPEIFNDFKWFLFQERPEEMDPSRKSARDNVFFGNIKHIINEFEKFPEFQTIIEKLKNFNMNKFYGLVDKVLKNPNAIKVLNHGDMWVNNVLIRNASEIESQDAVFVDFQITYYGSLGLDLQYFLNTSIQTDQHYNRDKLIEYYYKNFEETLKNLNYNGIIPTLNDIHNEINRCEIIGFMAAEVILLVISIDRNESKDNSLKTFLDKDKIRQQLLNVLQKNERVIEILKTTIKRCDDLKIFD